MTNYIKNELIEGIVSKEEFISMKSSNDIDCNGCVLISIHDPDGVAHTSEMTDCFDDFIQMFFWDIEKSEKDKNIITKEQGLEIKEFIKK